MPVISQYTPINYRMKQWFNKEIYLSINVNVLDLQMFQKQLRLIKESRSHWLLVYFPSLLGFFNTLDFFTSNLGFCLELGLLNFETEIGNGVA